MDYSPSTDILFAECPDIHQCDLLQRHKDFIVIVEVLREHSIKHFILDFTGTVFEVNNKNYRIVMNHFQGFDDNA